MPCLLFLAGVCARANAPAGFNGRSGAPLPWSSGLGFLAGWYSFAVWRPCHDTTCCLATCKGVRVTLCDSLVLFNRLWEGWIRCRSAHGIQVRCWILLLLTMGIIEGSYARLVTQNLLLFHFVFCVLGFVGPRVMDLFYQWGLLSPVSYSFLSFSDRAVAAVTKIACLMGYLCMCRLKFLVHHSQCVL